MQKNLRQATAMVDHLLLGVADLAHGIAWAEEMTGVRAVIGGSHPGVGTRNALASLGGRRYLEIIAPDPAQTAYTFQTDLRALTEPRLVTWAAGTTDIDGMAKRACDAGFQIAGPRGGSRTRPDGEVLRWKTLRVLDGLGQGGFEPIPFFIEWAADSVHPSQDSPVGCELQSFHIEHLEPERVIDALKRLRVEAEARRGPIVRLKATLTSPKGKVELS